MEKSGKKSNIKAVYFIQFSRSGIIFMEKRIILGIFRVKIKVETNARK